MKADRVADFLLDGGDRRSGCDTARQVRHVCGIIAICLLDHVCVAHQLFSLRPACFKMLLSVPGARSSDGLPATVTRPALVGSLSCLWLPQVATRSRPSASIILIASRTFMPGHDVREAGCQPIAIRSRLRQRMTRVTNSGRESR